MGYRLKIFIVSIAFIWSSFTNLGLNTPEPRENLYIYKDENIEVINEENNTITINSEDIIVKAESNFIGINFLKDDFDFSVSYNKVLSYYTLEYDNKLLYLDIRNEVKENYTSTYDINWSEAYISSFVTKDKTYIQLEDTLSYFGITNYEVAFTDATNDKLTINKDLKVPILTYHHLVPKDEMTKEYWRNVSIITVEDFERTIDFIYDEGYNVISFSDYLDSCKGLKDLPDKPVIITFDDGYYSNYEYAYPILKKYGFVASEFVITRYIFEDDPDGMSSLVFYDASDHLTWQTIKKMKDVFEYHTHTHDFHKKDDKNIAYYKCKSSEEMKNDLLMSESLLESRDYSNLKILAYPYGIYSNKTLGVLEDLEYDLALTVTPGVADYSKGKYTLNRYIVYNSTSNKKLKEILDRR